MKNSRTALVKITILLGLFLGVLILFRASPLSAWLTQDRMMTVLADLRRSTWGPLAFVFLYTALCAVAFPGTIMTFLGGVLFGTGQGTVYNVIGATAGACLAYGLARFLGRDFVELFIRKGRMAAFDNQIGQNGFKIILVMRIVPIFPFTGINFGAGLSKVKFKDFFVASLIGMIPATFIYTYFAESLYRGRDTAGPVAVANVIASGALLLTLAAIPFIYNRMKKEISAPPPPEA